MAQLKDTTIDGSLTINGNVVADYVVEQGSGTNYKWRKWNSGKIELWYTYSKSTTISTVWGNMYRDASASTLTYPITFNSVEQILSSVTGDSADGAMVMLFNGKTTPKFYLIRGASLTTATAFRVDFYVVGT